MTWQLTSLQCFFIAIIAFGVIGFQRGWRREIITLAFTLTGILFLSFGSQALTEFVYIKLPRAINTLTTGQPNPLPAPTIATNDPKIAITAAIAFLIFIALGYIVSLRVAPKPSGTPERIFGIIPGIVMGYAILQFISIALNNSSLYSVNVVPPTSSFVGNNWLIVFVIIVGVVILALISVNAKKRGGTPSKKP
jgi:drug/metabolite transporter (DMT)-like permease